LYLYKGKNNPPLPGGQQETEGKAKAMKNFSDQKGKGSKTGNQSSGGDGTTSNYNQEVKRKILVVSKDYAFSNGVVDYAANLSQRLGYDIIAMSVNPGLGTSGKFFSPYNQHLRGKFTQRAQDAWVPVASELASQGIKSEHVVKFEGLSGAIKDLNHEIKRIDFVITDSGIKDQEITGEIPLPVFSISGYQGEKVMAQDHHETAHRGKLIRSTIGLGLASAALYAAVFTNTGTIMTYFTKGGIYAALPIVTVFAFSFVYGPFTSNLWSLLGIEATKKVQPRVAPQRPAQRKRPRPRLHLDA
jgi:hypothetical protein